MFIPRRNDVRVIAVLLQSPECAISLNIRPLLSAYATKNNTAFDHLFRNEYNSLNIEKKTDESSQTVCEIDVVKTRVFLLSMKTELFLMSCFPEYYVILAPRQRLSTSC